MRRNRASPSERGGAEETNDGSAQEAGRPGGSSPREERTGSVGPNEGEERDPVSSGMKSSSEQPPGRSIARPSDTQGKRATNAPSFAPASRVEGSIPLGPEAGSCSASSTSAGRISSQAAAASASLEK
jgi:hypothetical protein